MFSKQDLHQFLKKGITKEQVEKQIDNFNKGFPKIRLESPATIDNGILQIDDAELECYEELCDKASQTLSFLKFVPASGAASRMFQTLFHFLNTYENTNEAYLEFLSNKEPESAFNFFNELENFAFYGDLRNLFIEKSLDFDKMMDKNQFKEILSALLNQEGLNYGNLPKALLQFHKYGDGNRTAFEEHLVEALNYTKDGTGNANIHLSISEDHKKAFEDCFEKNRHFFEEKYKGTLNLSYSVQKSSTDTIAVNLKNNAFRDEDGNILFRPGGHGALIENLNDLNADLIFIKNIDNVVPDRLKGITHKYKKAIGGILLEIRSDLFSYLHLLETTEHPKQEILDEILTFLEKKLCIKHPPQCRKMSNKELKKYLFDKLNRPIRVCGMVKNEGEPGGGPFWTHNNDGSVSLQIVETSQIDQKNAEQKRIFKKSTHFNPVDLVCCTKDYKGNKFDLLKYVDSKTGFISQKTYSGRKLKAMELPGLWNGAMSDWNTIFVEVPPTTFNPVKTVFDLLRIEHRSL